MKKKFLALIMSLCVLSTTLISCGKTEKEQVSDNKSNVENKKENSWDDVDFKDKVDAKENKPEDDKAAKDDKASKEEKDSKEDKTQETLSSAKGNIADVEDYTVLLDAQEGVNYKKGDYAEVDFALQLLKDFFAGKNIYDRLVSDTDVDNMDMNTLVPIQAEDKADLEKKLKRTRLDMNVPDGKNINVEPLKIEKDLKLLQKANCDLMIRLKLVAEGGGDAYANSYSVNVFKVKGEYKASMS